MTEKKIIEGQVVGSVIKSVDALTALNNVIEGSREYLRIREQERTKRAVVSAYAALETQRIKAAESVLNNYFQQVFAERTSNFSELLNRLDDAAREGNDHVVTETLAAIVAIAQKSPLADLADLGQIRKALDDPDHVWEL